MASEAPLTVVVVGLGQMGRSHALAYHNNRDFKILCLVNRSQLSSLPACLQTYPLESSFETALSLTPDIVSISTHPESHAHLAILALQSGSHVFLEKPLATTLPDAEKILKTATHHSRKLLIGHILRHHPTWQRFISHARSPALGGPPYVLRMNLNQRSTGPAWAIHRKIISNASPIVDCGVHYVDVMLQITKSRPVQVRGMGVKLGEELEEGETNYGHLQVLFEDGSVGWYEAGWGPMMSENAWFVKDVVGREGCVSLIGGEGENSADVVGHTKTSKVVVRRKGEGVDKAEVIEGEEEPGHDELCALEQEFLLKAIREDFDLTTHMEECLLALKIVLAADQSMKENRAIDL